MLEGGPGEPKRKCPDDGTCHHDCGVGPCFRVQTCGPLSGVYPRDEWPASVLAANAVPVVDGLWPGSIGSDTLPGLSKLGEECGELGEVVCKFWGSGGPQHWTGDLIARLCDEIADVQAAIDFVAIHCELDPVRIAERTIAKRALFEQWHNEAREGR